MHGREGEERDFAVLFIQRGVSGGGGGRQGGREEGGGEIPVERGGKEKEGIPSNPSRYIGNPRFFGGEEAMPERDRNSLAKHLLPSQLEKKGLRRKERKSCRGRGGRRELIRIKCDYLPPLQLREKKKKLKRGRTHGHWIDH